jgi:class 3 adenylate cyclase
MLPETKYAKSGDIHIAYQVTGTGSVDLVWAPGTTSHLDLEWDWPPRARFIEQLGSFSRLIRFDKRGTGLSDRPANMGTLEDRTDDIRAVMDSVGSERAAIFGVSEGVNMACVFAATYPNRTHSLILYGGQARWVKAENFPLGPTLEEYRQWIERVRDNWPFIEYITGAGAGLGRDVDPAFLNWYLHYARAAASPAAIAALEQMNAQIDTRDILPTIQVPTLVMNRTADPVAHIEAAHYLAARIPGARFVEFPGQAHVWTGIEDLMLAEMEEFLTGVRPAPESDRVLATVLFTDIIGSTERAAALGDHRWRDLRDNHHAIVRRELVRHRGHEVETAGDSFLATFDGPARAIRCAIAVSDAVRQLGIEIRAGLHTGEVELMGDKVGGLAVHIGARVAARAGPSEVLVSSTVKDLVAGSGVQFIHRGTHVLKGVPGEWRLFAVER